MCGFWLGCLQTSVQTNMARLFKKYRDLDVKIKYFYVYILQCCNDEYYVGQTGHLINRLYNHIVGHGSVFTKKNLPYNLVHLERFNTRYEAESREIAWFRLIKNKKHDFNLPPEFDDFFYRISAMAAREDRNKKENLLYSLNILEKCNAFIKVPQVKEWGDYK